MAFTIEIIGYNSYFFRYTAEGEIAGPVQSQRGAYLVQVASRTPFDSAAYASQRSGMEERLLQDKKSRFLTDWLTKLRESAEIEDHRDLYFR